MSEPASSYCNTVDCRSCLSLAYSSSCRIVLHSSYKRIVGTSHIQSPVGGSRASRFFRVVIRRSAHSGAAARITAADPSRRSGVRLSPAWLLIVNAKVLQKLIHSPRCRAKWCSPSRKRHFNNKFLKRTERGAPFNCRNNLTTAPTNDEETAPAAAAIAARCFQTKSNRAPFNRHTAKRKYLIARTRNGKARNSWSSPACPSSPTTADAP